MNTKLLMSVSAAILGATGLVLSFLPQELKITTAESAARVRMRVMTVNKFFDGSINWFVSTKLTARRGTCYRLLTDFFNYFIYALKV